MPHARKTAPAKPLSLLSLLLVLAAAVLTWLPVAPAAAGASAAAAAAPAPAPAEPEKREYWYTLDMFGGRSGYMHAVQTTASETITSDSTVVMAVKRGALQMDITMKSSFVETLDGKPISMRSEQTLAGPPVVRQYTFGPEGITLVTSQGGRDSTTTLPNPEGSWLTPAAAERMLKQRLKSGAQEVTIRVMDPNTGAEPVATTRKLQGTETLTVMGREIEVTRHTSTVASMPGVTSTEWLDDEATLVKSQTNLGGISVTIVAATEVEARGEINAPELMISTFVTPNRPIERARQVTRGVYLLKVPAAPRPEVAATGSQSSEVAGDTAVRVIVDTSFPHAAPPEEVNNPDYLAATSMLDCKDPAIIELTDRALRNAGELNAAESAERLRRAVYRHIRKKNLGTGFASATSVAKSREGDCSEHAVLLTAMLRARGIPARVATGVLYVDEFEGAKGIFGYHMWSQALLEIDGAKRWVDLDATLPANYPYDATHITANVSSLGDEESVMSLAGIATMMGRLEIEVESIEHGK